MQGQVSHLSHQVKKGSDPPEGVTLFKRTIQMQLIACQGGIKSYLGAGEEPIQVHGYGTVAGEA
jgi:hypothetical protein